MGEQLTRQRSSSSRLQGTVWDPCMAQLVSFAYRPDMFPQEMDWINFSFVIRWILTNVKTVQWFFDGHLSVVFFFSNWSRFPLLGVYFKLQKKSVPYPTISCFIPKNVTEWTEVIRATLRHNTTQLLYWESSSFMSIYVPQQKSIHCWYFQLLFYFFSWQPVFPSFQMIFPALVHPGYNCVFFSLQFPGQMEENGHQFRWSVPGNI